MSKETNPAPTEISSELIGILKKEGDKAFATCLALNTDPVFSQGIASIVHENFKGIEYKAEHILLRDIVKIFGEVETICGSPDKIPPRTKFILIYLYERLQGKDLTEIYKNGKITDLPKSVQFNKNAGIIRETYFFQSKEEMQDEFLLPSLLLKTSNEQFLNVASLMSRIAALMVKSGNTVTKQEEELLKNISERINNPRVSVSHARYNEVPENDSLEKVMSELQELIGMDEIKKNVEDLINFLKVQKIREEKGLKTSNNSLHAVFMGPPGTGKTTVARMLGRIFKHLGYIKRGHLVETDRAGMVAGYVGQTAIKSDEIIKTAVGGVLFIDEAYSLTSGGFNDFGREAIEILLKRMEDQRDNFVVVVAGYPEEIEMFIQSNPGLQSRFNRYFKFDHFRAEELMKIFKLIAKKADFVLTEDAEGKLAEILERIHEKRHRSFGNARTMRNLFEKIIERQANRIVSITPITEEILMTLVEEDIPDVLKTVKEIILFEEEEDSESKGANS